MKAIKLFGVSAFLLGIVLMASGCASCSMPKCEPINLCPPAPTCAPTPACPPVVESCSPCGY